MKKCPKCGNEIDDNAAFCSFCGEPQKDSEEIKEAESNSIEETDQQDTEDKEAVSDAASKENTQEPAEPENKQSSAEEPAPGPEPDPAPGPVPGPGPKPGPNPHHGPMPGHGPGPHQGHGDHSGCRGNYHQEPYGHPHPSFDPRDHTREFDPWDIDDNRLIAVLPYLFSVLGMIAAVLIQDSPFVRFHLKNEIRLTVAALIACIVCLVPFIGWLVGGVFLIILCVLKVIAIIQVLSGKAKEIPILCTIDFLR